MESLFYCMNRIKLHNSEISFREIRPEGKIDDSLVLLFLHEALGSIGQWKAFPELLCKQLGLNGIIYERQGHGASSPFTSKRTKNYLHEYAWIELPELIDTLLPPEKKVLLVGHSDGGTIALLFAAKYPKKVHSIITMAAHVINEPETQKGISPAINAFVAGKLDGLRKYHGNKTEELFYAWANTWLDDDFFTWNICTDIQTIEAPLLAIQGENDQYGTLKQLNLIESSLKKPISKVVLPNCGHHPHLEQMSSVLDTIKTFYYSNLLFVNKP